MAIGWYVWLGDHIELVEARRLAIGRIGLTPEQQAQLFKPFQQVDSTNTRQFGGTGLGLAIVKRIVNAHRGSVDVRSQVGSGSTFTVTLPTT